MAKSSLYDLAAETALGETAALSAYRGKVTLIVNVASQCGFTPQYEGLEKLHRELSNRNFSVLAFPCNDFGGQEPGSNSEVVAFCRKTYDVTFPIFARVVAKSGPSQSAIYSLLAESGHAPRWNFGKYLVDKEGRVIGFFNGEVPPEAAELRDAVKEALESCAPIDRRM